MAFNIMDYRLGWAQADTTEVEELEKRWPEAVWIRFGDKVVFYRRPKGVALMQFMQVMKLNAEMAHLQTVAYLIKRDDITPERWQQHQAEERLSMAPGRGLPDAFSGSRMVALAYRSQDGRLTTPPSLVLPHPTDPKAEPITWHGSHPAETRS